MFAMAVLIISQMLTGAMQKDGGWLAWTAGIVLSKPIMGKRLLTLYVKSRLRWLSCLLPGLSRRVGLSRSPRT